MMVLVMWLLNFMKKSIKNGTNINLNQGEIMSYIDSYNHEYIGRLGYLPIYRVLENIGSGEWGAEDFTATPNNLVLGGGSGEHPALVVHKLESLVARFLFDQLTEEEQKKLSKEDRDYIDSLYYNDSDILEFCDWSIARYSYFRKMAKKAYTPLKKDEGIYEEVEDWLYRSLGELIYFSLPELNPEQEKLQSIFAPFEVYASMRNVICTPPNYPPKGGRIVENGKLKWGLHRW